MTDVKVGGEEVEATPQLFYVLSARGGCAPAAVTRCKYAWDKLRQLVPLLTNRHDLSL